MLAQIALRNDFTIENHQVMMATSVRNVGHVTCGLLHGACSVHGSQSAQPRLPEALTQLPPAGER